MSRKGCLFEVIIAMVGATFLLAALFLVMNRETQMLTAEVREMQAGDYITLSDGVTHYQLRGPANAQVVVLIHGFSVASYVWDHNVTELVNAGFRVLTYDLFGRGYSDRPEVTYNLDLFTRQLNDLLTVLKIDRPVDVVGLSMGGYIAAGFTNQHPERVRRVILMAPQSVSMASAPGIGIATLPGLGEYLFTVYLGSVYLANGQEDFKDYTRAGNWSALYLERMQFAGTRNALLSTLRNMTGDPIEEYRHLGRLERPVMIMWAEEDQTNPFENAANVRAAIPAARFEVIPSARHLFTYERPEIVNPLMVEFLKP